MPSYPLRFDYGVCREEVLEFAEDGLVLDFLNKFNNCRETWMIYATGLCRFFKWLRVVKGLEFSPKEFLNTHIQKRSSLNVEDRRWALSLALQFSRDNPDLRVNRRLYVSTHYFNPVKNFCACYEAPLTTDTKIFRRLGERKFEEPAFTVAFAKKVLNLLNQRDRSICMTMLQSGQSTKQVLVDINQQADYVINEIEKGAGRIRFDFSQRKGNSFPYFTWISTDAIVEIQKWLPTREAWLNGKRSKWLWVTDTLQPMTPRKFHANFKTLLQRHKVWTGPYTVRTHMFRKIFESEASPPDRGISKPYVGFWMGHKTGKEVANKMEAVGGTYDNAPRIYVSAVEREYEKLEPFINIYSGRVSEQELLEDVDMEALKMLLKKFKEGKVHIE